ncbi:hypothetical protein AA098_08115 [Pseudomonas sp. JY-Q]|nr:hypothetical protein AA098_08115 [Pseudomonas sp. JY-Q]
MYSVLLFGVSEEAIGCGQFWKKHFAYDWWTVALFDFYSVDANRLVQLLIAIIRELYWGAAAKTECNT